MTSSPETRTPRSAGPDYIFAGVIIIWAVFFLSGVFSLPLLPPDEPKYAFAASQMIETGDFISPTFNCGPRFDKPPLIYWAIAASYEIFGKSDWASRVPSLLATLGIMLLLFREGKRRFDSQTAVLSVVVFATLFHVWAMGRAVAPEILLVFFETAAILSFFRGLEEEKKWHITLGYISAACAFLTKGPVGIIIPFGVILCYFSYKKGIRYTIRNVMNAPGIALFLLIGLPWYVRMFQIHGYGYFEEFFLFHNIYRFTGQARQHPFAFYYYVPFILGSYYLWLPFSKEIWDHTRKAFREKTGVIFFVFWAAFVFLFFTVSVNKLHNYILIAYPPLALVIGNALRQSTVTRRSVKVICFGMAAAESAVLAYAYYYMEATSAGLLPGGLLVVFFTLLIIARGDRPERILPLIVLKALAILLLLNLFMAGYESRITPAYAFVRHEVMIGNTPVYYYRNESEDLVYYANRCIIYLKKKDDLDRVLPQHETLIVYVREKEIGDLEAYKVLLKVPFNDINGKRRYLLKLEGGKPPGREGPL